MAEEKLQELMSTLADLMSNKDYHRLSFQFKTTDHIEYFPTPIPLKPNRSYVFYLKRFSVYNTLFNVDETNNKFTYSQNGTTFKTLIIPPGAYELNALNLEIQEMMKANGDYDSATGKYFITLTLNQSTSKTIMNITGAAYVVDFSVTGSLNSMLGFPNQMYLTGKHTSNDIILITMTNDIFIHCDLVNNNSYHNGKSSDILYTMPAYIVPVGAKQFVSEIDPVKLPLTTKTIPRLRIQIKDDNGKLLNFNGEAVSMEIIIHQV